MSKELSNQDFITKELAKYSLPDAKIAELRKKYLKLKVSNPKDLMNYDSCKVAHQEVKGIRINIEKTRKDLKASSLSFGKKVDVEAKRLSLKVEEIETYLLEQRKIVEDEKARIIKEREDAVRAEQEKKEQEERDRVEQVRLEQEKKEQEERDRVEQVRLEQERKQKELDDKQAELKAKEDAIKAEQERREQEIKEAQEEVKRQKQKIEDDKQKAIEIEEAKKKAIEDEKIRAEEEKVQKAKDEINRIADEKAEAKRLEALKPDLEKIKAFGELILAIPMPKVKARKAKELIGLIQDGLEDMGNNLIAAKL